MRNLAERTTRAEFFLWHLILLRMNQVAGISHIGEQAKPSQPKRTMLDIAPHVKTGSEKINETDFQASKLLATSTDGMKGILRD